MPTPALDADLSDTVPRQLLLDSQDTVARLKRQLNEALANQDSEVNVAAHTLQAQLRAVQKQLKTTEEQLQRSLDRERDLREQVVNTDVVKVLNQVRKENKELREQNEALNEQASRAEESEAQLILTRNKLEALREDVLRQRDGNSLEVQSMREEVATLKKALQDAEMSMIQGEKMTRRVKEMQEAIERSAEQLNEKDRQILEIQEELDRTSASLSARDGDTRVKGTRIAELERELRKEQRRAEEALMMQAELESVSSKQMASISGLEEQLEHSQQAFKKLSERLNEAELQLAALGTEKKLLEDRSSKDSGWLTAKLKETESQLEKMTELSNTEAENYRASRDEFRYEIQKLESEGKHLREVLRKERDLLEKIMREQSAKETEYTERQQRYEAAAARREVALQNRLQSAERELDALRLSSVPDSKLSALQDEFSKERDLLKQRLDIASTDLQRAEQQKAISLRGYEQTVANMATEADIASSKIRSLERQLQEAEESLSCERKARLVTADQLRAFKGERVLQPQDNDVKLSKVGQAAIELVGNMSRVYDSIERRMAEPTRERAEGQQRTALGIVVAGNAVEMIVPGSPAAVSGMISVGDEILSVDGKSVQGSAVTSALRGDDLIGGIVSIRLRKRLNGEVLEVHLPRADIFVLQQRQNLMDDLAQFSSQAVTAAQNHQPDVLGDRLEKILAGMKALEQLDVHVQYRLCMQVVELRKGFSLAIQNASQAVNQVDKSHQQVHALQDQTEEDLREQLAAREGQAAFMNGQEPIDGATKASGTESMQRLHSQIFSLGKEIGVLTNDLNARELLLEDAKRDSIRLREALLEAEEKAVALEEGQKTMRKTMSDLHEELADAVAEMMEYPYAVAIRMESKWEETMRDVMAKKTLELQLGDSVSRALRIPKNAVSTVCYHREGGHIIAVIKLCSVMRSGGNMQGDLRTAKSLAQELTEQMKNLDSALCEGPLGNLLMDCTLQGPLCEATHKAIIQAALDREQDDGWRQDQLLRMSEELKRAELRVNEAAAAHRSESELLRMEIQDLMAKSSQANQEGAEKRALLTQQELERQHSNEKNELQRKHQVDREDWNRAVKSKEYEIAVLKQQLREVEISNSGIKSDREKSTEVVRTVQDANHKLQVAAAQMRELVEAEVNACVTTLNSIESEMAFFHAYQIRTLQIAKSISGEDFKGEGIMLTKNQQDATTSKEMVEKDIEALRVQLENLATLTRPDGELAQKFKISRLTTARMTPSRTPSRALASDATQRMNESRVSSADPAAVGRLSMDPPITKSPLSNPDSTISAALETSRKGSDENMVEYVVTGSLIELQNLPKEFLPSTQISAAVSVLSSSSVDLDSVEHVLPGSHDLTSHGFIPFFRGGLKGKRSKSGKELKLIIPMFLSKSFGADTETKWETPQVFSLQELHGLQAADRDGATAIVGGQKLSGDGISILVTLMAGSGGTDVPRAYARCVFPLVPGDDLDQWYSLQDLEGDMIADGGKPASIRLRASYLGPSSNRDSSLSSVLWKRNKDAYVC